MEGGCSWQSRTDTTRATRPSGPPPPFQAPDRGKLCFSFVTPGDRAGEVRANGASCSGVGMPHSQGFVQDWTGSCQRATLGIWGLQRAGPEQATGGKSSTMKTARTQLSGEPGELGTLLILWGSQLWRPPCRVTQSGADVRARLRQKVGFLERIEKLEEPSPSQNQWPNDYD